MILLTVFRLNELGRKTDDGVTDNAPQVVVTETKLVGSYAKGTMLKENLCADIVAITKGITSHICMFAYPFCKILLPTLHLK